MSSTYKLADTDKLLLSFAVAAGLIFYSARI